MFFLSILETSFLKKLILPLFIFSFIFLALVPIIGVEVKGAKRWLDFYIFRLQPIELLKPFFILITVQILTLEKLQNSQIKYIFSFIIMFCNYTINRSARSWTINSFDWELDCNSVYFWSKFILYFWFFFNFFSFLKFFTFFIPEKFGYIINRLVSFIDPNKGDKFQSSSALDAIKLGGLKGQGMGEGVLKDSVPEAHTDYIIAIISEEYGSIISILIIFIFLYISFRIIKNCVNQEDQLIKISLCGLSAL